MTLWLAKTKNIPSYWSYKTGVWVDVGLPTTDADIATLFLNYGTNNSPTQQQLELLGTGINRPNRCCYQPVVATQPTINVNAVPTGKTIKPTEVLPILSIEGIDSASLTKTITSKINDETGKMWTEIGAPTLSKTQSKFGGSSLSLNGASSLSLPSNSDFNFGLGDFTVAGWIYMNNNLNYPTLIAGTNTPVAIRLSTNGGAPYLSFSGSDISVGSTAIPLTSWHHLEIVRKNGIFYIFLDGNKILEDNTHLSINFDLGSTGTTLGHDGYQQITYGNCYIDEFVATKTALHTANFTPPTAPYTKDDNTISLLHFNSSLVKAKLAVTLDLKTYYKFNGVSWEVINIDIDQDNMMDIETVTSINRNQWDLLTKGIASGIAFAYYLDISGIGDTVKIDKTSLVVDMKGEWNSAIKGSDFKYGYPANDILKVTLLNSGDYKINYSV